MFGLYLSLAVLVLSARPKEAPNPEPRKKINAKSSETNFTRQVGIVAVSVALVFGLYLNQEIAVANARSFEANNVFDQSPAAGEALYPRGFQAMFHPTCHGKS